MWTEKMPIKFQLESLQKALENSFYPGVVYLYFSLWYVYFSLQIFTSMTFLILFFSL